MTLFFQRIKAPDGVNDAQIVQFDNTVHLIISFGSMIRIFSPEFKLVHGFLTPFNVLKVLPYQDHYFLIGRNKCLVYKGTRRVSEHSFAKSFEKIDKILAIRNFLVILHDGHYSLAKIQDMQIRQESALTDSAFFTPLSAEKINDFVYILAKTYSKRYMITYSVENSLFKCQRREVSNGSFMFSHLSKLVLLDEKGMWLMNEKLSYIRDFGNYKISCAFSSEAKPLLFCKNGEVLSLDNSYRYEVLGLLDCSIDVVSKIGDLYFCGSKKYSYLLKVSDGKIQVIKRYACIGKGKVIDRKGDVEMICNKDFVSLKCAIPVPQLSSAESCTQSDEHGLICTSTSPTGGSGSTKRLKTTIQQILLKKEAKALRALSVPLKCFFKSNGITVFNFGAFSIVNGIPFKPISHCSSYGSKTIFNTSSFIFEANRSKGSLTTYKIDSSIVRYFGPNVLIFKKNVVSILNTDDRSFRSYNVNFELCDFCIGGKFVYCVDFNEHIHKLSTEDFSDCHLEWRADAHLAQFSVDLDSIEDETSQDRVIADESVQGKSISSEIKHFCNLFAMDELQDGEGIDHNADEASSNMLNVNGKLLCISNGEPYLIVDIGSFISYFISFNNTLVIFASKTYTMDLISKELKIVDVTATSSFVYQGQLYLCADNQLVPFELKDSYFVCRKAHCDISNSESLVYRTSNDYVYSYLSIDQKTINYKLCDYTLSFPSHIESCSCVVRKGLLCVGLINVDTKASKLVFITVKGKKLKIRREIPQDSVPLSICSFGNTVVSICPDQIAILKIRNNRIKKFKHIESRNDLCSGSFFVNKSCILISSDDWCFKTVNLKKETVKKTMASSRCIPFALSNRIGYAIANKIYFPNGEIDCIEDISNIISTPSEILVFGRNGAVFQIKEALEDERSSSYIYETSLKYRDITREEGMTAFE